MTGWGEYLFNAIGKSDVTAVSKLRQEGPRGEDAWNAHLSLFPAVQRVLNPPFINPHLPKMYAICRELRPYMELEDIPGLLYMESMEYARRQKLELHLRPVPETEGDGASMPFSKIEEAIRSRDAQTAASCFAAYLRQHGARELARRLLLIGSGYLVESLGHSLSCTVFILQEVLVRQDQDPWPALVLLADYFIKGRFDTTPSFRKSPQALEKAMSDFILRSTTGSSFIDIHHTITLYAIERARGLFSREEYEHLVASWLDWMGDKESREVSIEAPSRRIEPGYGSFYEAFSALDTQAVLKIIVPLTVSHEGRKLAGRFLIKGLCDLYQGDYNPHYVTGLGAALWAVGHYADRRSLASNALHQYIAFLFQGLKGNG
ncbi:MAG TPA: hypothetical protein VKF36_02755 [Syntrophorhabdales bacterium]|nr:hypothetical protein [Syntrophorhabdales bacterium]